MRTFAPGVIRKGFQGKLCHIPPPVCPVWCRSPASQIQFLTGGKKRTNSINEGSVFISSDRLTHTRTNPHDGLAASQSGAWGSHNQTSIPTNCLWQRPDGFLQRVYGRVEQTTCFHLYFWAKYIIKKIASFSFSNIWIFLRFLCVLRKIFEVVKKSHTVMSFYIIFSYSHHLIYQGLVDQLTQYSPQ